MASHPTEIRLHEADELLEITWSDGSTFMFSLWYLRGWCPCAKCQGHFAKEYTFVDGVSRQLMDVRPVGGYAIQPVWADGHDTGFYAFDWLQRLQAGPPSEGPSNAFCMRKASEARDKANG